MSSWNYTGTTPTRGSGGGGSSGGGGLGGLGGLGMGLGGLGGLGGIDTSGGIDLKALLSQVTGGSLGGSLGGLGGGSSSGLGAIGGRSSGGGGGLGSRMGSSGGGGGSSIYGNHGGIGGSTLDSLGGGLGGIGVIGGGTSSSSNNSNNSSNSIPNGNSGFFDPFSSMSTFGLFGHSSSSSTANKDQSSSSSAMGGGGGGMGMSGMGGMGGMGMSMNNKSPPSSYSSNNHQLGGGGGSPPNRGGGGMFGGGGSHSPLSFFGSGGGGGGDSNNHFSSSNDSPYVNKFPISTFSIDDTIPGRSDRNRDRDRDSGSNYNSGSGGGGGNDDISSSNNGHFPISHFGIPSNNYRDSSESTNYNNRNSNSGGGNHNSSNSSNHTTNRTNEHGENSQNQGVRETGIIEKLLHSYGFIQCCERQARLFFHFSQFDGTIEHLKLGDPVEFEMTYDRRTGKPIASAVTKIGPEVVLSEERVTGTVTTELHHESNGELQGRISYENRGECFFLPYMMEDIEGNVTLSVGDTVSFQIATNQRSGNLTARYVRLENPARPVRYRGIVSSLKDNFGFIERADVAKEIFFQIAETRMTDSITIGDNVDFNIQTRNGKEVASSITKIPYGSVVFEDIGTETLKGQILKPIDKAQCPSPALGPTPRSEQAEGRLRYRGPDRQELEVMYGEKDQEGNFTMKHGDWVQFQLAVDRRNKQQRATNITLLEESFSVSGERREEGVISIIKGDCAYITCAERDQKMFFRFSELLDYKRQPKIADDVEFTIVQDPTSPIRQSAIRIKYLTHGSVQFEIPAAQELRGVVTREPSTPWVSQEALAGILPSLSNLGLPQNVTERLIQSLSSAEVLTQLTGTAGSEAQGEPGIIEFTGLGANNGGYARQDTIPFHWKDCRNLRNIRVGTNVIFDIHQVRRNRELIAANIRADTTTTTLSDSDSPTNLIQHFANNNPTPAFGTMNSTNGMGNLVNSLLSGGNPNPSIPQETVLDKISDIPPPGMEKDLVVVNPNLLMRSPILNSSSAAAVALGLGMGGGLSYDPFEQDRNPILNRASSSETEDNGDLLLMDSRKGSRSPSDCSDRMVLNGNYSSYAASDSSSPPQSQFGVKTPRVVMKGYIAALKDGFGFIETMAQDGEIFFHSSSLVGDFNSLEVGQEVEYVVSSRGSSSGKHAADIVKPLPKGSIGRAAVFPDILQGIVMRPLRGANPDQTEYTGLIQGQDGQNYPFGIISMLNKKELLQSGEAVEFQLDVQEKPVNIRAVRKKLRATVEAVKGQYGFLSYELEDGKKLFFHMSEVKDHQHLNPGDEVEFVILQNPRNGKSSACSVVKLGESQRPERLLNRLSKLSVDESAPRLIVVRQPFGPDGTKGFSNPRLPRKPGVLNTSSSSL